MLILVIRIDHVLLQDGIQLIFCHHHLLHHDIKSYCISKSEKCKVVLDYLILDGQFLLNSNLQILREDALRMAINHFAENFHSLMEKIIFPIYEKRFLARHNFLEKNSAHYKESIFPEALEKQD